MSQNTNYLFTNPTDFTAIPVTTKLQTLPFNELSWENFERLTLKYASYSGKLDSYCALYGKRGEKQEGIDLYVRNNHNEYYSVYQCKRHKKYSADKVKKAVDEFLKGKWFKKTNAFYLCTSCSLDSTTVCDEIERQFKRLKKKNIELIILDGERLSVLLKEIPVIVYDFFGMPWTVSFCGDEA